MRATARAIVLLAGLGFVGVWAVLAAPPNGAALHAGGSQQLAQPAQYWGGERCERLRRACVYKDERGESGEGNCRRYRAECMNGSSYCDRLRRACEYKDYRGETGEGNCRRYRRECE